METLDNERVQITSRDFYNNFNKKRINKFDSLGKKKADKAITYTTYCKIIKRFLLIYFYEVFFINKSLFFFLGGRLVRCKISSFRIGKGIMINKTISVFWYMMPDISMIGSFSVVLQKGSTNVIPKLRREFCKTNDIDLLPLKMDLKKKVIESKTLFRLW